jgi:hypothetical protein
MLSFFTKISPELALTLPKMHNKLLNLKEHTLQIRERLQISKILLALLQFLIDPFEEVGYRDDE